MHFFAPSRLLRALSGERFLLRPLCLSQSHSCPKNKPTKAARNTTPVGNNFHHHGLENVAEPQNNMPANTIATGNVSTQAIIRLRTVAHCNPE